MNFLRIFFLRRDFLHYQSLIFDKRIVCVGVMSEVDGSLAAYLILAEKDGYWQSPITGAFGGVSVKKGAPISVVDFLVEGLPRFLLNEGPVRSITIRLPPACFPDDSAIIANVLHRNNWKILDFDLNYHLIINSVEKFMAGLGDTKRKFIRRLEASGAHFDKVDHAMLEAVYLVIQQNRLEQGYPMTMSLEAIADLVKNFPNDIYLFAVTLNSRMIASAICIRINPQYLYVFYWAEMPDSRKESPVLFLAKGIYAYCVTNGLEVMDIGTSSLSSVPNYGLCAFKASLGCLVTLKSTYRWTNNNDQ